MKKKILCLFSSVFLGFALAGYSAAEAENKLEAPEPVWEGKVHPTAGGNGSPGRLSIFVPDPRYNGDPKLRIKFHRSQGPVILAFMADLKAEMVGHGDNCHLCPGEVCPDTWCRVCGHSCCYPHAKEKLVENTKDRHRICDACVRELKREGLARPTHEELFAEWRSEFDGFYLSTSVRIPAFQKVTVVVSHFSRGVRQVVGSVDFQWQDGWDAINVDWSISGLPPKERANLIKDMWAGRVSAKVLVDGAPFLLNAAPEFQPAIFMTEIENRCKE